MRFVKTSHFFNLSVLLASPKKSRNVVHGRCVCLKTDEFEYHRGKRKKTSI